MFLMLSDCFLEVVVLLIVLCKCDILVIILWLEFIFFGNLKKSCNYFFEIYFIKILFILRNMIDCCKIVEISVDLFFLILFVWCK